MIQPIRGMDKPKFVQENLLIDYVTKGTVTTVLRAG